jgi:hypothetical protein
MARPTKAGLEYFPLDCDMDDKVKLIDAKFGVSGFGILIKIWQIIYDNGYYTKWTERELLLYKNRINADINLINDVIDECLKWGIFDINLHKKYSILTSSGIQKRFFEATRRRTEVAITDEYLLVPIPGNYKPALIDLPLVYVNKNSKNADSNTQSKVKESKKKLYLDFVYLTDDEHKKLVERLGETQTQKMIERLNNYIGSSGRKYKSHYHTILSWWNKDQKQQEEKQKDKPEFQNGKRDLSYLVE